MILVFTLFVLLLLLSLERFPNGTVRHNDVYVNKAHTIQTRDLVSKEIKLFQSIAQRFINELVIAYPTDPKVQRLQSWSGSIRELKFNSDHILASSTNKGEYISICFMDNRGNLNARNEVMWVLLHELAHVMTSEYKHNEHFWRHNRFLVKEAIERGYYTNVNYNESPRNFCGSVISYNF
jgi:hypothetical protein